MTPAEPPRPEASPPSPCPTVPPEPVRRTLRRTLLWPSRALVGLAVLLSPWLGELPPWALYAPFVASLALFGLPHGAADHLAVLRLARAPLRPGPLGAVLVGYLALAAAYGALWLAAPALAFTLFIAITWAHWGQGDVHAVVGLDAARHVGRPAQRVALAVVRGGLPMLLPLVAFPQAYRAVAGDVVGRIAPGAEAALAWAFEPAFRLGAGLAFAAFALGALGAGLALAPRGARRDAWADGAETALLAAYFLLVPPILAVGLYFCAWHAPRHIARLMAADPEAARHLAEGRPGRAWARFALAALPLTFGALAIGAGLYTLAPVRPERLAEHVGLYLILIAALTLPHTLVVAWMDRAQGVWRPPRPWAQPSPSPRRGLAMSAGSKQTKPEA